MTYDTEQSVRNGQYLYELSVDVKNNGVLSALSWKLDFDLPSDAASLDCGLEVDCSVSGSTVTVTNKSSNGLISAGGGTSFDMSFMTSVPNYVLQNIYVSGVIDNYSQLAGLTVDLSQGDFTKNKNVYTWPVTFTVSNNHGYDIEMWRLVIPWSSSRQTVSSMPSTVTYTTDSTQLIISGKTGLGHGEVFSFTAHLTSTDRKWVTTAVVEGIK